MTFYFELDFDLEYVPMFECQVGRNVNNGLCDKMGCWTDRRYGGNCWMEQRDFSRLGN